MHTREACSRYHGSMQLQSYGAIETLAVPEDPKILLHSQAAVISVRVMHAPNAQGLRGARSGGSGR